MSYVMREEEEALDMLENDSAYSYPVGGKL